VLLDLRSRLLELSEQVLDGEVEGKRAAIVGQLYNVAIRAVEVQRKVHETEELEARIEALEREDAQGQATAGSYKHWG